MTKEQEEAIERLSLKSISSNSLELKDYPNIICFKKDVLAVLNMLKEKDKEIEKYKYLYQKALDNNVKADKENMQLKKQIDLMAEYLIGIIFTDKENVEILFDNKEEVKQYFERKSEEC